MNEKESFKVTWHLIKTDLNRFGSRANVFGLYRIITSPSFRVTFWFRIGHYLVCTDHLFLRKLLLPIIYIIHQHNAYLTGIILDFYTSVGEGLAFGHFSNIVINNESKIGNNVTIAQGVTIGNNLHKGKGAPVIGDNCVLAPGAKILGPIEIGRNTFVGANAVITKSFPEGSVLGGINGLLNMKGEDYVKDYF